MRQDNLSTVREKTMKPIRTRRSFFSWTRNALAAAGWLPTASSNAADQVFDHDKDYYDKLGVAKIINAAGTYTALTASIMPTSVQKAVAAAAKHPVRLADLQKKSGEYLAKRLQCEAALVCAGAASGLTLGTAACMTVGNLQAAGLLPQDVSGLKNQVIIQKAHRYSYDHAISNCGTRFVEVETLDQYEHAFNDHTVMCHFFNAAEGGQITREQWIDVAHRHGVPCFNDAAADMPPISNLWNYTKMGFDLVTFSGGKGIRGPQNAGLLLGRKDLIEAAGRSNNPHDDTVGRGMKVAKEQIVGMVAAVDWLLDQNDEELQAEFRRRANLIAAHLNDIPTLRHEIVVPPVANAVPHLIISYDQMRIRKTPLQVAQTLREGTPGIELNPSTGRMPASAGLPGGEDTIVVGVWMLQDGEDRIVARRLRDVLLKAAG